MMPIEEQRRKNRRTGLLLGLVGFVFFAYTAGRQIYLHYFV
jgi:hypothetical protein